MTELVRDGIMANYDPAKLQDLDDSARALATHLRAGTVNASSTDALALELATLATVLADTAARTRRAIGRVMMWVGFVGGLALAAFLQVLFAIT